MAEKAPVIIKKISKRKHAPHHGGSWKVAYADFVTAMMAFFLLMWLLNSTSDEQKQQLSQFFEDPILFVENKNASNASIIDFGGLMRTGEIPDIDIPMPVIDENEIQDLVEDVEKKKLLSLKYDIDKAISDSLVLSDFKEQLKLDITAEGLRIQIIDKENKSMFDIGSAYLTEYAYLILEELSNLLNQVPNRIRISGHTDATPFSDSNSNYSNWELSTDRANSARRAFLEAGMSETKIGQVVGLASSVLLDKKIPTSPVNRRISILVLNQKATQAIGLSPPTDETTEQLPEDDEAIVPTQLFLPF